VLLLLMHQVYHVYAHRERGSEVREEVGCRERGWVESRRAQHEVYGFRRRVARLQCRAVSSAAVVVAGTVDVRLAVVAATAAVVVVAVAAVVVVVIVVVLVTAVVVVRYGSEVQQVQRAVYVTETFFFQLFQF